MSTSSLIWRQGLGFFNQSGIFALQLYGILWNYLIIQYEVISWFSVILFTFNWLFGNFDFKVENLFGSFRVFWEAIKDKTFVHTRSTTQLNLN